MSGAYELKMFNCVTKEVEQLTTLIDFGNTMVVDSRNLVGFPSEPVDTTQIDKYWIVGEMNDPTLLGGEDTKRFWFLVTYIIKTITGIVYVGINDQHDLSAFTTLQFNFGGPPPTAMLEMTPYSKLVIFVDHLDNAASNQVGQVGHSLEDWDEPMEVDLSDDD